jgi:hypothetical protein
MDAKDIKMVGSAQELVGKVIERAEVDGPYSSGALLRFSDGSACHLRGFGEDSYVEINDGWLDDDCLFALGFITEEERVRRRKERAAESEKRQQDAERRQYEALKAKFG